MQAADFEWNFDLDIRGKDILIAREAALDEPAINHGAFRPHEHSGSRLDRQVNGNFIINQITFDQLEGLDRDNWRACRGWRVIFDLGRCHHPGQAAAVGTDHRNRLGREFDQHTAQCVAGTFQVRGENGPANQLPQAACRYHMIAGGTEIGYLGKQAGILDRQRELGMLTAHQQVVVVCGDL